MANALAHRGGLATYDAYLPSAVILHMWERGGGMCLLTVKYKSLVYSTVYAPHELEGIIPPSTSHTAIYGALKDTGPLIIGTDLAAIYCIYLHKTNKDATFKAQSDIINKV